jgi:hypothetical protein
VLAGADAQAAYASGPAGAGCALTLVVDPSCGVCTAEVRDLAWALARQPTAPTPGLLIHVGEHDDSARAVAAAVAAAAAQGRAWELLEAIAAQGDERSWTAPALAGLAKQVALDQAAWAAALAAPATSAAIADQQRVIAGLAGSAALPRLYLDGQELGGYCPRESLAGILAVAAATAEPQDLLPDLGR